MVLIGLAILSTLYASTSVILFSLTFFLVTASTGAQKTKAACATDPPGNSLKPSRSTSDDDQQNSAPVDDTEEPKEQLIDLDENDVVIGQSSDSRKHPGNGRFHRLICQNVETYVDVFDKFDKTWKAKFFLAIVQTIHKEGGRFVKRKGKRSDFSQDLKANLWVKASLPDVFTEIDSAFRSEAKRRRKEQKASGTGSSQTKPDSNILEKRVDPSTGELYQKQQRELHLAVLLAAEKRLSANGTKAARKRPKANDDKTTKRKKATPKGPLRGPNSEPLMRWRM